MDTLLQSLAPATEPSSRPGLPPGLPSLMPKRTWAGHGSGMICDLCQVEIGTNQIEYEVELPHEGACRTLRLHLKCYQIWFAEIRRGKCR